jgi:tetratricopeptide (TPR) repeat protein/CHAT domain-containing protein
MRHWASVLRIMAILLLSLIPPPSFGSQDAQEGSIEEAKRLNARVVELCGQAHYEEAIPLAQRALAIAENLLGPDHPDIGVLLNSLADLYTATGTYEKAQPLLQRALAINEKVLGPEHRDTAASLNNLAELYRTMGAYAEARPLYQRALAINEKVLGSEHPDTAGVLNNLAMMYEAMGEYAKAEALYQRALAINEKVLGSEHRGTALSLNNLAEVYRHMGEYAKAEPLYIRALTIDEKVLGPEHPDTATSLNNLALLYHITGKYEKAEPLYERGLAIEEKVFGPEHPQTANMINNLAGLYNDVGEYAKAEPLYIRALTIGEKVLGPDHPQIATWRNNLAGLYEDTGEYAKAEPLYQLALASREKALGSDHPDTATSLNNLASLYQAIGEYAKAEPLYRRALVIREKALGPDHPETADSLNNLARLYQATGAYAEAEPLYQRALEIREKVLGPEHPETAGSLNNLAYLYEITGAYGKAEPLYQQALVIGETILGSDHPYTAIILSNLGLFYQFTGAYAKAEPLCQRALAIREKLFGAKHLYTATSLNNLARLYHATGAYAKAESLYQQALAIQEKALGPAHPQTATLLNNLGALYETRGAYVNAVSMYKRAQVIEETDTAQFLFSGSEARKQAYLQQRAWSVSQNVSLSLAHPTAGSRALGFTGVLQYKGRVLDAISGNVARLRRSASPEDQALFDQLSGVAQELSTLTFRGPGKLSSEAYRQRLDELAQQQEKLEADLSTRSATIRQAITPITLERVCQALPPDAVLVEWFRYQPFNPKAKESKRWGAPRYVAYVLKRSGNPVPIDVGAAQPLEELVAEFRAALGDPASNNFKAVAEELYKTLVQPLRPQLAHSERLLLSPDGALNLLPFAALVDEHGDYLVQHFELSYLTSGRDLLRMSAESSPRSSSVVLADPNYGPSASGGAPVDSSLQPVRSGDLDRSGLVFTPLPGTSAEAKLLQSLLHLDAKNVLTGDRATEANLRELHGPRILHAATHGFFFNDQDAALALKPIGLGPNGLPLPLGENPLLRSGLAMAGANARHSGTNDDGILTAAEAAQLDLVGTQLVVLSACDTGVGAIQNGEGVYGLRRALVLAGAQAQLVSLWEVADVATQELMQNYYQRLLKGEGRSEALRSAQLTMLAKPERQHPYYWAGFIPIGQWTSLAPGR